VIVWAHLSAGWKIQPTTNLIDKLGDIKYARVGVQMKLLTIWVEDNAPSRGIVVLDVVRDEAFALALGPCCFVAGRIQILAPALSIIQICPFDHQP
jgi:hypothetical protein